jgi:hypothetical protein
LTAKDAKDAKDRRSISQFPQAAGLKKERLRHAYIMGPEAVLVVRGSLRVPRIGDE